MQPRSHAVARDKITGPMPTVDLEEHLRELALEIDRLKVLYEQYFLGMEKQAPSIARREVEKRLATLAGHNIGNTATRFRYLGLVRKWKLYIERWDRVLREIENGTFSPHVARAKRRLQGEGSGAWAALALLASRLRRRAARGAAPSEALGPGAKRR